MKWRTECSLPLLQTKFSLEKSWLIFGSCFAENLKTKLHDHFISSQASPFGLQYHPIAIANGLTRIINKQLYDQHDLVNVQGGYATFDHHGSLAVGDPQAARESVNNKILQSHDSLKGSTVILITFGTAFGYFLESDNRLVNNCHKQPAEHFCRRLSHVHQLLDALVPPLQQLLKDGPDLKIVVTVSPVRHIRDDLCANTRSKGRLIDLCHELTGAFTNIEYFPAYELLIDDLRDYRFYAEDLVHPSAMAIDYIWRKFCDWCLSRDDQDYLRAAATLQNRLQHRSHFPGSKEDQQFNQQTKTLLEAFKDKYSFANLRNAHLNL